MGRSAPSVKTGEFAGRACTSIGQFVVVFMSSAMQCKSYRQRVQYAMNRAELPFRPHSSSRRIPFEDEGGSHLLDSVPAFNIELTTSVVPSSRDQPGRAFSMKYSC
jgi:hypothetical protein